jgi:hypothetical protein
MDWAVTMFLMTNQGDGRYTSQLSHCANLPAPTSGSVNQRHRLRTSCEGDYNLHFNGSTAVGLLPTSAHSGDYLFWSNRGDESDMTLTREFDLTNASGPVTMSFAMWYDLETDYDYVFLEASTDGKNWEILSTPSGTAEDPSGNSYGWGYNGQTEDWKTEEVDLSQFAVKGPDPVRVRHRHGAERRGLFTG